MELKSNNRMWRAWNRAMKYGYFMPYWPKYWYLCEEHQYRLNRWINRELNRIQ